MYIYFNKLIIPLYIRQAKSIIFYKSTYSQENNITYSESKQYILKELCFFIIYAPL